MRNVVTIVFLGIVFSILIPLADAAQPDIWEECTSNIAKQTKTVGVTVYTCCDTASGVGSFNWRWVNQNPGPPVDDTTLCDPPQSEVKLLAGVNPIGGNWQRDPSFSPSAKYSSDNGITAVPAGGCGYHVLSNGEETVGWTAVTCSYNNLNDNVPLPVITVGSNLDCRHEGTDKCRIEVRASDGLNTGANYRDFSIDFNSPVAGSYTLNGKTAGLVLYTNGPLRHLWGTSVPSGTAFSDVGSGLLSFEVWRAPYNAVNCKLGNLGECVWGAVAHHTETGVSAASGSWSDSVTNDWMYGWHSSDNVGHFIVESAPIEVHYDTISPIFSIQYYSDSDLTVSLGDNPKLKAGTYYIKITSNEALGSAPTITIYAEGTANDVTNAATTSVAGNDYKYTRTISTDVAAVGLVLEDISITGTDVAGNPATNVNPTNEATKAAYTDTTPPSITLTSVGGDTSSPYLTHDNTPDVVFTTNENAWCKISETDQSYDSMATNCGTGEGTTSHTCTSPLLSDGVKNLYVSCRDAALNKHTNADNLDITVTVDTRVDTQIDSGPTGTVASTSADFTFSCVGETCTILDCKLDGGNFISCNSGSISYSSLSQGLHTFQVKGTDAAGNIDTTPAERTWTVDTLPPARSAGQPTGYICNPNPTLSLTTDESATCKYKQLPGQGSGVPYDNPTMTTMATTGSRSHSQLLSGLTPQTYRYDAKCKDGVDNKNTDDFIITFDICSRSNPTVTITPASQQGEPGDTKTYTIQVTNNDVNAGTETFDLSATCDWQGWTCQLKDANNNVVSFLPIASGSSASLTLSVTSYNQIGPDDPTAYDIPVTATNRADQTKTGSGTATYRIICVNRLTVTSSPVLNQDKHGDFEGSQNTWTLSFRDSSSTSCPNQITYTIPSTSITGCHPQTGVYTSPNPPAGRKLSSPFDISVPRGGNLNNAFKVFAKREGPTSCTLSFNIKAGAETVDPSFTVRAVGAPASGPHVSFFDFSGDASALDVKWEAFYPDEPFRTMEVKCGLRCDPRIIDPANPDFCSQTNEKCSPYPVQHPADEEIKKGSCDVLSPAYDFTRANDNNIQCLFRDPINQNLQTYVRKDFTPVDFAIQTADKIATTVGTPFDLKIDVANKGILEDSYMITLSGPATVDISPTDIKTSTIGPGQLVSTFSAIMPLVDETSTIRVTVRSLTFPLELQDCSQKRGCITKDIELNPGFYALPEFGLAGFLQIILIAAIVYFLFGHRIVKHKSKPKRRR